MEETKKAKFYVGQNIDVCDTVKRWANAQILQKVNNNIYIHFTGWSAKYDENIDQNSPRILQQWEPGKKIQINNRVDAYHSKGGWLQARVIQLEENQEQPQKIKVKVHFTNYHKKYDQWMDLNDPNQIAIIGSKTSAYGIGSKRSKKYHKANITQIMKKMLQEKNAHLVEELKAKDMRMIEIGGDGNCLFRSISHQLYGDEKHYSEIRELCMRYLRLQKGFFQDYITGDIDEYIQKMSQNGEWGDDVELQAFSEIYRRPIEIYALEAKPIRTFHQDNQNNCEPLRLAYVGMCHYNSIKLAGMEHIGIMDRSFGEFQNMFLMTYQQDMLNGQNIFRSNRTQFANSNRIEESVGQRLEAQNRIENKEAQVQDNQELQKALEISEAQQIENQIMHSQINQIKIKQENQKLKEEIKTIQEKQLEEAKRLSESACPAPLKPYWFNDILAQGFQEQQIWFAIEIKGYDPDAVQNFLLDNM